MRGRVLRWPREIAWLSEHGLMAEEGKRHRLLRLAVEEDLIEQHDGRGCTRAASRSMIAGFFAPPPEATISSSWLPTARPIASTVSAVAVATASLSEPPAFFTRGEQLVGVLDPEALASRALGRRLFEVRIGEHSSSSLATAGHAGRDRRLCRTWRRIDAARDRVDHADSRPRVERERTLTHPAARHPTSRSRCHRC